MPYIPTERRDALAERRIKPYHSGELNYLFTRISLDYIREKGGLSYGTINDIIGALECAKQELYRRLAVPYEDDACRRNGDVYPPVHPPKPAAITQYDTSRLVGGKTLLGAT